MFVQIDSYYVAEPASTETIENLMRSLRRTLAHLDSAKSHLLERTINRVPSDPHIVLRICFDSARDYECSSRSHEWQCAIGDLEKYGAHRESVMYEREHYNAPRPGMRNGIWRCLIFALLPGVEQATRGAFETEMLLMPTYVPAIRNWALSRIIDSSGSRQWDYVWEQDFDDIDGLLGEYRNHPVHWGLVDTWFDPENPRRIVDSRFRRRLVCRSPESAIEPPGHAGPSRRA